MRSPTDEEITGLLMGIISDGFNGSIGEVERHGAINTKKMRSQYKGIGSKYYDLVTEQIALTAKYAAPAVRELFESANIKNA